MFDTMDKDSILHTLREAKQHIKEKYSVNEIALFGSYSRGEQTETSDIDLMVALDDPLGFRYFDLVYELKALFDKEVEVVSKGAIKPQYFEAIQNDLIYA